MDPKTYEQAKAIGARLKAQREAEAQAVQEAKKIAAKAATRPVTPKPVVEAVKQAKPPAQPKQTPPSAASVVTPPVTEATRKSKVDDDLRRDLKLDYLYSRARTASDVDEAVGRAAKETGLQPQRYKELAAIQGIDLEDLDKKARGGMPFENYRQAKKDAIGFVPVEQRASMFEEIAKDFETAQKGEIRTDKRIGLAEAEEAPGTIPGFTTGYVVGGTTAEETPEVAKSGEHYYAVAQAYLNAVDKNPEVVKLVNLYGNSFAGGASQKYINDRTRQLMQNKGITPSSPDADRQASLARRQATFEVLARKTVGQWTPGIFVKDVQVTDDAAQTSNPLAALAPNVELIGFNNKGEAVFRQESPAGVMLRTLDLIGVVPVPGKKIIPVPIPGQSLLAGLATRGEDETYTEAMSRGVQTGANWLEYALDESKGAPLPVRALAGVGGMAMAVVHPDVTAAAGSLNEAQKAFRVARVNKQVAKEAVPILGDLIEAYKAQDFDRASALEKKLAASELLGERSKKHSIVKAYDRNDAAFAMALASLNPALKHMDAYLVDNLVSAVGRRGNAELTRFIYESGGKGAPHMHFSAAAPEMAERTKEGARGASFMTFLDSGNFARRKERIQKAKEAFLKAIPATAEEALARVVDDAVDRIRGRMNDARVMGVDEADLAKDRRLAELMEQNKATFLDDPSGEKFKALLRDDPVLGGDANATWRANAYRTDIGRTTYRIKRLKENDYQAVKDADLKLFDDALAAVDTNVKSRMMAAESLRRNLADKAEIRITPIDILDEVLEEGTERLSPYAQASFLVTARQFPKEEMDRKELYLAYQALDSAFQGVAERLGVPVEEVWRGFFVKVEEGAAEMPGTAAAKAAGKPPPKPPAKPPAVPSDVPKLANVPQTPELEAAITEVAKKAARTKPAPVQHPQTLDVLAKLTGLPAEAKATPDNVSKILKAVDTLGAGATFPTVKGFPGQTKKLVDAVRDQLLESGVLVKLDDGKVVKAGEVRTPTGSPPVEVVDPATAGSEALARASEDLSKVNAQIEETDDLLTRAQEIGDGDEEDRLQRLLASLERTQEILEKRVESLKARAPAPTPAPAPAQYRSTEAALKANKQLAASVKNPETLKQAAEALDATPYGSPFKLPRDIAAEDQMYITPALQNQGDLWFEEGEGYLRTVGGVQPSTTPERLRDELEDVLGMLKRRPNDAELSRRATLIEDAIKRLEEAPALELEEGAFEATKAVPAPAVPTPTPVKLTTGQQAQAALAGFGEAAKIGGRIRAFELYAKDGFVEYGNPAAADLFRAQNPTWTETKVNGKFRFTPTSPQAALDETKAFLRAQGVAEDSAEMKQVDEAAKSLKLEAPAAEAVAEAAPAPVAKAQDLVARGATSELDAPLTVTHRTSSKDLDVSQVDPLAERASRQTKRKSAPKVGFYTYGPEVSDAEAAQYGARKIDIQLPAGTKILDVTALEGGTSARITKAEAEALLAQGVQVIRGKDVIGPPEYVILDKALMKPAAAEAVVEAAPVEAKVVEAVGEAQPSPDARMQALMAVTPGMSGRELRAAADLREAEKKLAEARNALQVAERPGSLADERSRAQYRQGATEAEARFDAAVNERLAAEAEAKAAPVAAPAPAPVVEAAPVAAKVEPAPVPVPAVPAVKPAATLENLGNREIWSEVPQKGRIKAAAAGLPPQLQAKISGVEFRISAVPAEKAGKPPVFRIIAKKGEEVESLGGNFESLEDALRALTPTASGPAPLRAEIDKLMRARARPARIKAPEVAPVQAEEIIEEALDEGVPEQVARLEAEAPAAVVEEAAPVAAAVPTRTVAEKYAQAREEIGKLTHVSLKPDGTAIYGRAEGDMFVPEYALGPAMRRNAAEGLYSEITAGRKAVDEPRTLKEAGAIQFSPQSTLDKLDQMMESDDLYQTAMVDGKLVRKGKTEFLSPAQTKELRAQDASVAIITLFRGTADPTTLLHEGAHYIRRMGLDSDDMDAITKWIKTEGVEVEHKFGNFVGDAAQVERAEELFAQAFEQYLLKGEAPQPALKTLFEKVKEVFGKVYRTLSRGPLGKEIQPEVKAVFDRLFTRVPDKKPESTFDMFMRQTFNNKGTTQDGGLTVLAREAKRRGIGGKTIEDLGKMVAAAGKQYGDDWLKADVIEFPGVPVFGKEKWTGADIVELDQRVLARRNNLELAPLKQALFGDPEEEKLTESIYTAVAERQGEGAVATVGRKVASGFAHAIIGGDIVGERHMRNLPQEIRRSLDTSTRIIEQAIGDTISVLSETIRTGDMNFMYRYLAGETGMTYNSGRRVISSGHEFIAGFLDLFRNAGDALTPGERALLQEFAQAINTRVDFTDLARVKPQVRSEALARLVYPDLDEIEEARAAAKAAGEQVRRDPIRAAMQQKATDMMKALDKFRELKGSDDQSVGSMLAKAMKGATQEGAEPSINEFRYTETLLYLAGITPRNGKFFSLVGENYNKANLELAARTLLDDAQEIYGTVDDQLFSRRMAILVGAYGSASRAKAELAELGLVLTKEEAEAYKNWALGYAVTPEMRPRIEGVMRKLGANTKFEADTILAVDMYVPKQARERIAEALGKAQFSEQRLTKMGDIYQVVFAFMKKRMTRGNLLLRQRYFMVNTIDHFFQMSLIVGYAPAFQSVARVALQNVMASLPGQAFETIVRGINLVPGAKIDRAVVERLRDKLSEGGDRVAFGLRSMFSDSKYRIEVNHVLEGRNTPIVLGGRVTTGKRLREIMVGEGILESYNTRRLGQVIRQEGTAFLNDGDGIVQAGIDDRKLGGNVTTAWARIRDAGTDLTFNVVDDIGDAWAERERVGAAITLIENGYEPRLACRLTVDALYDYAQSMTKGDRSWLVGLMFPFWAFQKNANQQFINVLATPYGAYRMMVMKRFRDRGSELLTELYYDAVGGELGLDVNQMPQDMQDMYFAIMTKAHEVYGDELPEEVKLALRMALTGRSSEVIDGKYYELDDSLISMLKSGGVAGVGGAAMSEYMLPRPDKAILPSYMRERPGVFIAQRRNALVRLYSGLRGKNDEMFYLMLPEASFEAAFKHVATVFASGLLVGGYVTSPAGPALKKMGIIDESFAERGIEGTELLQAIKPVLDLERSPIAGPVIGMYAERGYPQKLHPAIAAMIQDYTDIPVLRVPGRNDPFENDNFILEMEKIGTEGGPKDMAEILGEDYIRTVQELNSKDIDPNDLAKVREENFYLPPGAYSIAFENTLGELNKELLLKWTQTPAERAESAELLDMGNILYLLRNLTGLELASVSASRTAQQEEPVFYTKSKKPF